MVKAEVVPTLQHRWPDILPGTPIPSGQNYRATRLDHLLVGSRRAPLLPRRLRHLLGRIRRGGLPELAQVQSVPNGDVNGLVIATVAGALGLALLGAWLQEHEGRR